MSKYYLDKFLYTTDRDPELLQQYKSDPAGYLDRWEREIGPRLSAAETTSWLCFTEVERTALIKHDYCALFELGAHFFLSLTTHAGVWGATTDDGILQMTEHGFMNSRVTYVHSSSLTQDSYQRIAASGGNVSVSAESEDSAGRGYPCTYELRRHGIPVSLSMDTSVWWSADMFSAMRATINADGGRAITWAPTPATKPWSATMSEPKTWCVMRRWVAATRWGWKPASVPSPRVRKPTSS